MAKPPAKRKRPGGANITPEGRQRLSDRMRERHANGEIDARAVGKLGGRGNTREKRRAAQDLAEKIRSPEIIKKMTQVIEDGLDSEQAMGTRLKTLELATKIEAEETKLTLQEEAHDAQSKSREELMEAITSKMSKGRMAMLVKNLANQQAIEASEDDDVIDADVVDDDD